MTVFKFVDSALHLHLLSQAAITISNQTDCRYFHLLHCITSTLLDKKGAIPNTIGQNIKRKFIIRFKCHINIVSF